MATIDDVARDAGVSASTVSYVLSGKRTISAETQAKVARSVRKLGYRPNASARALASKKSGAIGLVAPFRADNNVPVLMQFVAAIATAARVHDHDVLLVTQEEGEEGLRRVSHTSLVDAVLVMDVEADDSRLPMLRTLGLPSVLIGLPDEPRGLSCVDLDRRQAAVLAVEHLAQLGHRSIAMVGAPQAVYDRGSAYALRFTDGFESAAAKRGLAANWVPVEQSFEATRYAVEFLLDADPAPTALIVQNEAVLAAVLAVLERRQIRVPEDISVVAIGPTDLAVNQRVPLTGIDVQAERIGASAVEMLMKQLKGDAVSEIRLLSPELIQRESSREIPNE